MQYIYLIYQQASPQSENLSVWREIPPNRIPLPDICNLVTAFAASLVNDWGPLAHTATPPPSRISESLHFPDSKSEEVLLFSADPGDTGSEEFVEVVEGKEVRSSRTRYIEGRLKVTSELGMAGTASWSHKAVTQMDIWRFSGVTVAEDEAAAVAISMSADENHLIHTINIR